MWRQQRLQPARLRLVLLGFEPLNDLLVPLVAICRFDCSLGSFGNRTPFSMATAASWLSSCMWSSTIRRGKARTAGASAFFSAANPP